MNDYKELIAKCDYWINLGDEIDKKLAITKFMEECRDAIEQLVGDYAILAKMYAKVNEDLCVRTKERDAAVADIEKRCWNCGRSFLNRKNKSPCKYAKICANDKRDDYWQWRGVQEDNDETD